jgi:hypothetical protein
VETAGAAAVDEDSAGAATVDEDSAGAEDETAAVETAVGAVVETEGGTGVDAVAVELL